MPTEGLGLPETILERVEALAAETELSKFEALPTNWDGYGADRIDPETVKNARSALKGLRQAPAPELTPNPNGTISLEWESPSGLAHLEVGKTRYSFYVKPIGGDASVFDGDARNVPNDLGAVITAVLFPSVRSVTAITNLIYTAGHERAGF
jgi:hypothetical protein